VNISKSKRSNLVSKDALEKPGPGMYEPPNRKSTVSFTMGKKQELKIKNDTPGPGNYEPMSTQVKDSLKSFNFGKATKKDSLLSSSKSTA
jgi:hypothetical protein